MNETAAKTVIEQIHALGRFTGKPGLHRIRALCAALGNPQDRLRFVHLAGTNGKGSTATMLESVLRQAGYRTGLYTSPYLVTFHERIRVNGVMIGDEDLDRLFHMVMHAAETLSFEEGEHLGEFECITALAFLYFVEQGCEIVVLETGLGGEFDATNVIASPEAALITSVSRDHLGVLGNSCAEIARTKAGIFKPGSPHLTTCGQLPEVLRVLQDCAPDLQIAPEPEDVQTDFSGTRLRWKEREYHLGLLGNHQAQNAAGALLALEVLCQNGWKISEEAICKGLNLARIDARLELIQTDPTILLDGAHNPDGMRRLIEFVKQINFTGKIHLILGMCADKQVEEAVKEITITPDYLWLTPLQNERSLAAEALAALMPAAAGHVEICKSSADALAKVRAIADPEDCILICGSLYLAGEIKKLFP